MVDRQANAVDARVRVDLPALPVVVFVFATAERPPSTRTVLVDREELRVLERHAARPRNGDPDLAGVQLQARHGAADLEAEEGSGLRESRRDVESSEKGHGRISGTRVEVQGERRVAARVVLRPRHARHRVLDSPCLGQPEPLGELHLVEEVIRGVVDEPIEALEDVVVVLVDLRGRLAHTRGGLVDGRYAATAGRDAYGVHMLDEAQAFGLDLRPRLG